MRKEWTQQDLADALERIGAPIDRSTIAKIESRKRNVSLDELFWFAAALGVAPGALVLPRREENVRVGPLLTTGAHNAMRWFRGLAPLSGKADDRFFFDEVPDQEVAAERRLPGIHRLIQDAAAVLSGLGYRDRDQAVNAANRDFLRKKLLEIAGDAAALAKRLEREEV
jgi:transcriptional regulator with XRE-family HTH domain